MAMQYGRVVSSLESHSRTRTPVSYSFRSVFGLAQWSKVNSEIPTTYVPASCNFRSVRKRFTFHFNRVQFVINYNTYMYYWNLFSLWSRQCYRTISQFASCHLSALVSAAVGLYEWRLCLIPMWFVLVFFFVFFFQICDVIECGHEVNRMLGRIDESNATGGVFHVPTAVATWKFSIISWDIVIVGT